jgi:DNA replication protein DnaC
LAARDWSFALALERAQQLKRDAKDFELWHAAFNACRTWHAARGTLYLFGPEGSGKTVLSWCLARQALESDGPAPLWLSLPELLDMVEESYTPGSPARHHEARAKTAGLLLLDEVGGPGCDRPRKRQRDCLFKIINHRADHKLPTVITTNLPPAALAKVFKDEYDRTIARLINGEGVLVEGKSFRLIQAEGRW